MPIVLGLPKIENIIMQEYHDLSGYKGNEIVFYLIKEILLVQGSRIF